MQNQNNNVNTTTEEDVDYIQAIQELKDNTVPKEKYEKLKEENSKLLKSIINGETLNEEQPNETPNIAELRKELFNGDVQYSNLEYATKVLQLRSAIMNEGGTDPFLPHGSKVIPDNNDVECANRVASVLQECIDYANGDSGVFTAELQRRTADVVPSKNRK